MKNNRKAELLYEIEFLNKRLSEVTRQLKELDSKRAPEPWEGWTFRLEGKKCGSKDKTCKCHSGNKEDLHGPYWYGYKRRSGKLSKKYIGKDLEGWKAKQAKTKSNVVTSEKSAKKKVTRKVNEVSDYEIGQRVIFVNETGKETIGMLTSLSKKGGAGFSVLPYGETRTIDVLVSNILREVEQENIPEKKEFQMDTPITAGKEAPDILINSIREIVKKLDSLEFVYVSSEWKKKKMRPINLSDSALKIISYHRGGAGIQVVVRRSETDRSRIVEVNANWLCEKDSETGRLILIVPKRVLHH